MSAFGIIILTLLYLLALFIVAYWGRNHGQAFIDRHSHLFYGLGLAVYCTAWTFYGSIGRAATHGLDFLAVYLGPVAIMPIWWFIQKKMVRIASAQHLGSLSDFIAARYGKNWLLGLVVTVLVVMAITPYIALQIKAISSSANVMLIGDKPSALDLDLASTGTLLAFTLLYGTRFAFDTDRRYGLVAAIVFESLIKVTVAVVGGFMLVKHYGGQKAIFSRAIEANYGDLLIVKDSNDWFWMMLISAIAFFILPRQFQMGVVSNRNEADIKKSLWMLPLYLLLMNIWVVPIALAGNLQFGTAQADYHFLNLALHSGYKLLPAFIFIGGIAACTSMIIVSTSALGNMVSNNILVPLTLGRNFPIRFGSNPANPRRLALVLVFAGAYLYYQLFVHHEALVSIGMISFIGIAQLAPGFFGGLFSKKINSKGVLAGLSVGFAVWLVAFGLPQWTQGAITGNIVFRVFPWWSPMANIISLSLGLNVALTVGVSMMTKQDPIEENQAEIFYNILRISKSRYDRSPVSSGQITYDRLEKVLQRFIPMEVLSETLFKRYTIDRIGMDSYDLAAPEVLSYAERLLTQNIGPAAARIVLSREIENETMTRFDFKDILLETQATRRLNMELQQKSEELHRATEKLTTANERLQVMGKLKDDFLYTVTHELRSPLTAIRAQIELVHDDENMPDEIRSQFLQATIRECERLTHLISGVLDLEKFESGNQQLALKRVSLTDVLHRILENQHALVEKEGLRVRTSIGNNLWLMADEDRVEQVMINLLSNAIKHAKSELFVRTEVSTSANVLVHIEDDGDGVPEHAVPHLFEKFFQSEDQTIRKKIGSGLGLAISHNIVRAHTGRLWLSSNPPTGRTTFSVEFPKHPEL